MPDNTDLTKKSKNVMTKNELNEEADISNHTSSAKLVAGDDLPKATGKSKKEGKKFGGLLRSMFPFLEKKENKPNHKLIDSGNINKIDTIKKFNEGLIDVKDLIAPAAIEIDFNHLAMGNKYFRTLFALGYPKFVGPNWLEPLIDFEHALDISTFYYPVDSKEVLIKLRRKTAEMEATINADIEAGKIADAKIKVALADAKELQEQLAKGTEKFFHFALYITIHADTLKDLEVISRSVESTLGAIGVIVKPATLQQDTGFESTIPTCTDKLYITRNMDTTSLATTFPFVTSELTMDEGIMYGINKYNKSLVVFDKFQLENANCVIFAKSGAGKSYMVKLELLRSLMFGVEAIIIDPEREYEKLAETIGGSYISFSQDGSNKLNPFELTGLYEAEEDELRSKILSLHGLIKVMLGGQISSEEDAVIDRALILTYKEKGISPDPATHVNEPPLLEDLYKVLKGMAETEAHSLASRLEKYIKGSAAGIFDRKSNIDINNTFTVFGIRDLSDELRPVAMYVMLEYIWTKIKRDKKKRMLVVDEAWWMMQYPDAARFLYSIAKRARKYYLGVTTITQDVEDFLNTEYGKAIVTNSSIQVLMKQSPAAVDRLQKVFYLSEGEKTYLLSIGVGEGLFFAGPNHVAIEIISSKNEHRLITSNPEDLAKYEKEQVDKVISDDLNKEINDEAKTSIGIVEDKENAKLAGGRTVPDAAEQKAEVKPIQSTVDVVEPTPTGPQVQGQTDDFPATQQVPVKDTLPTETVPDAPAIESVGTPISPKDKLEETKSGNEVTKDDSLDESLKKISKRAVHKTPNIGEDVVTKEQPLVEQTAKVVADEPKRKVEVELDDEPKEVLEDELVEVGDEVVDKAMHATPDKSVEASRPTLTEQLRQILNDTGEIDNDSLIIDGEEDGMKEEFSFHKPMKEEDPDEILEVQEIKPMEEEAEDINTGKVVDGAFAPGDIGVEDEKEKFQNSSNQESLEGSISLGANEQNVPENVVIPDQKAEKKVEEDSTGVGKDPMKDLELIRQAEERKKFLEEQEKLKNDKKAKPMIDNTIQGTNHTFKGQ